MKKLLPFLMIVTLFTISAVGSNSSNWPPGTNNTVKYFDPNIEVLTPIVIDNTPYIISATFLYADYVLLAEKAPLCKISIPCLKVLTASQVTGGTFVSDKTVITINNLLYIISKNTNLDNGKTKLLKADKTCSKCFSSLTFYKIGYSMADWCSI